MARVRIERDDIVVELEENDNKFIGIDALIEMANGILDKELQRNRIDYSQKRETL